MTDNNQVAGKAVDHPFQFTGEAGEYFRIWIVNLALTIVTVGLYSPWAKVRRNRYLYGNTLLAGHAFDYVADPVKILKGRLVAVGLLVVYAVASVLAPSLGMLLATLLVLLVPFIVVASFAFSLRNTTWRNIRFAFVRDVGQAYRLVAVPLLLVLGFAWVASLALEASGAFEAVSAELAAQGEEFRLVDIFIALLLLVLFPLLPWLDFARCRFIVEHSRFGQRQGRFTSSAGSFYLLALKTLGVSVVAALLAFAVTAIIVAPLVAVLGAAGALAGIVGALVGAVVYYLVFGFLVGGYFRARRTNLVYGNIAFGLSRVHSRLRVLAVGWLYLSNGLAILASLGLLIPWATIRMARYVADNTSLEAWDLDKTIALADTDTSALGEELGELFDLDIGL